MPRRLRTRTTGFMPTLALERNPGSAFLKLLRARFKSNRSSVDGDPIPWALDDKLQAYAFVRDRGWRTPAYHRCANVDDALERARQLGSQFVIKQPDQHSGKGVYLLAPVSFLYRIHHRSYKRQLVGLLKACRAQLLGKQPFVNVSTLQPMVAVDIKPIGKEAPYWILEEFISSGIGNKSIPFDYKVYCFNGEPALVIQIDRNCSPPRVALFDGAFLPLAYGRHYALDQDRWGRGFHVLPRHPGQLLHMTRELARATGSRFVSVDTYDAPQGAVFGEFTFAPGAPDVGMITFASEVMTHLDAFTEGAPVTPLSGLDIDLTAFRNACATSSTPTVSSAKRYASFAASASAGNQRYGVAFSQPSKEDRLGAHWALSVWVAAYLCGHKNSALGIQTAIRSKAGFVTGHRRLHEFENLALERPRSAGKP